jgi:transposase
MCCFAKSCEKILQASGLKSKNDKIDAKGLSQMFAERAFRIWQPMGKFYYDLRTMTTHQQSLQEIKTMMMNQREVLSPRLVVFCGIYKSVALPLCLINPSADAIHITPFLLW